MAEKSGGLFRDLNRLSYGKRSSVNIFQAAKDNLSFVQRLQLQSKLKIHSGCVNTTCWNDSGTVILSGSDDQHMVVTNPYTKKVLTDIHTGHRANIFCARFLPCTGDNEVVSCSGDGKICYTNLEYHDGSSNIFDCHMATTYKVVIVPGDGHSFLSCGEDGTVRWFDLRTKTRCQKDDCQEDVLINCGRATCSLAVNPMLPWQLAAGCADSTIRIYDRRMLSTGEKDKTLHSMLNCFSPPNLANTNRRITSLTYSDNGQQLLSSYSSDKVYLFDFVDAEEEKELKAEKPLNGDSAACAQHRSCNTEEATDSSNRPLSIHKLRLRGDWSDTGPNARPESERQEDPEVNPAANIMQRMSTMLTRWLENHAREVGQDSSGDTTAGESEATERSEETESHEGGQNESETVVSGLIDPPVMTSDDESKMIHAAGYSAGFIRNETSIVTLNNSNDKYNDKRSSSDGVVGSQSRDDAIINENIKKVGATNLNESVSQAEPVPKIPLINEPSSLPGPSHMCNVEEICDRSKCLEISSDNVNKDDVSSVGLNRGNSSANVTKEEKISQYSTNSESNKSSQAIGIGAIPKVKATHSKEYETLIQDSCEKQQSDFPDDHPFVAEKSCNSSFDAEATSSPSISSKYSDKTYPNIVIDSLDTETCKTMDTKDATNYQGSSVCPSLNKHYSQCSSKTQTAEINLGGNSTLDDTTKCNNQSIPQMSLSGPEINQTDLRRTGIDSQSSDDSESEDERPPRTQGLSLTNQANQSTAPTALSPNSAARRLQTMFRRHREEKAHREEQERVMSLKLPKPQCIQSYIGHRNARTMIKEANFWGNDYIMCGSDCGHVFIWDKHTGKLVNLLEADKHVVNCVQPHPFEPILATSGIDYDVKLWSPISENSTFNEDTAEMVMERNHVMLAETRDTVTVPASFMLRLIASIHRVERARQADSDGSD